MFNGQNSTQGLRLIIGARVSSRNQRDKGTSLDTQEEQAGRYAEWMGATVVEVISEDVSGKIDIAKRKKQGRIVEMLEAGEADGLLWYEPSRMSRKLQNALAFCDWMAARGKRLFFVSDSELRLRPLDITAVIKFWSAEEEREKTKERTGRGREKHAKDGEIINGKLPFWLTRAYDRATDRYSAELNKFAPIAEQMHAWLRAGVKSISIATRLEKMGTPSPLMMQYLKEGKEPPRITTWNQTIVQRILKYPALYGELPYGQYEYTVDEDDQRSRRKREKGEAGLYMLKVPAIITRAQFDAGVEELKHRTLIARRETKRYYLLRGMIRHHCGGGMSGQTSQSRGSTALYICDDCRFARKPAAISANNLERWVIGILENLMADDDAFMQAVTGAYAAQRDNVSPLLQELERVEERLRGLKQDAEDITRALLSDIGKRKAVRESLEQRADLNEKETEATEAQKRAIDKALSTVPSEDDLKEVLSTRQAYLKIMSLLEPEPIEEDYAKASAFIAQYTLSAWDDDATDDQRESDEAELKKADEEAHALYLVQLRRVLEFTRARIDVDQERVKLTLRLGDVSDLEAYEAERATLSKSTRTAEHNAKIGRPNSSSATGEYLKTSMEKNIRRRSRARQHGARPHQGSQYAAGLARSNRDQRP